MSQDNGQSRDDLIRLLGGEPERVASPEEAPEIGVRPEPVIEATREVMFMASSSPADAEEEHKDCHEDSPCRGYHVLPGEVAMRGLLHDGESYISVEDFLSLLSRNIHAYHEVLEGEIAKEPGEPTVAGLSSSISMMTLKVLGDSVYGLTQPDNATDRIKAPDTLEDLLGAWETGATAQVDPLAQAIAKATEAAAEAHRQREAEGEGQ